jgi:hypothetical protein
VKCCGDPSDCQNRGRVCGRSVGEGLYAIPQHADVARGATVSGALEAVNAIENAGRQDAERGLRRLVQVQAEQLETFRRRTEEAEESRGTLVLERAAELVSGPRQGAYGHPLPNHERIARLWTARLFEKLAPGVVIDPEDVTSLMRLAKEARLIESPGHHDSLVDIPGYAEAEALIHDGRERRAAGEEL